jgi:hypothetical protein
MMALIGVLLWAVFRLVLPVVVLMAVGTYMNQNYYRRSVI